MTVQAKLQEAKADIQKLITFAGQDLTDRFLAIKQRLKYPENDLYYWIKNKTVDELHTAVTTAEQAISNRQKAKEADNGAILVGENDFWKVYYITTFAAAQKYGRDSRWCITGINNYGDKYWKEYTEQGVEFYFYITKGEYDARGTDSKFALALMGDGSYEIYDQQDNKVSKIPGAPEIAGLPDIGVKIVKHVIYDGSPLPDNIDEGQIEKVTIADNITTIERYAFSGFYGLTYIIIPQSVTAIEDYAFAACTSLKTIIIPNSVTSIGAFAFQGCSALELVHLGNSVNTIGNWAFKSCGKLKQINIPSSVTSMGLAVFMDCQNLSNVILEQGITIVPSIAFPGCSNLESITIPSTVTKIENGAFTRSGLKSIRIPDSVKSIGKSAFQGCNKLESVTFSNQVSIIPENVCDECASLQQVILGDNTTEIARNAFYNCKLLTSIYIPQSVIAIDSSAFGYFNNSLTITCQQGSYAEQFAKAYNIRIKLVESKTYNKKCTIAEEFKLYEEMWN